MWRKRWHGHGIQAGFEAVIRRVVLDTNVVLSALLITRGTLTALRSVWQSGSFVPLVSSVTAAELLRVLRYPKFKLSAVDQEELIADVLPFCTVVMMPLVLPVTPVCRDPKDVPFLQLALVGKADVLVTGDHDVFSILEPVPFRNLAPEAFLRELG